MSWYLAPSLATLRAEINARWPGRDRTSDGSIGDAAHQAGTSDHNPNSRGSVNAIDVDEDGVDFAVVFAAIKRHPSARYVIYERRMYHRLRGWQSEPYSGDNPHDKHFHLSIDQTRDAEQDRSPWGLLEDDMTEAEVIAAVQKALTTPLPLPGRVGDRMVAAGWQREMEPWTALARIVETVAIPRDLVDERQIAGELAGPLAAILSPLLSALTPQAIAAAIPADLAEQVAAELAARLAA